VRKTADGRDVKSNAGKQETEEWQPGDYRVARGKTRAGNRARVQVPAIVARETGTLSVCLNRARALALRLDSFEFLRLR